MGDKIGDYVHFHAQNYIDYGINHKGDTPSLLNPGMIKNQVDQLKSVFQNDSLMKIDFTDLETRLNWLMKPPHAGSNMYQGTGFTQQDFDEAWSIFQSIVESSFNEIVPPRIVRELGTIEGIYMPGVHRIKTKPNQKSIMTAKIVNGINALQNVINSASNQTGYSDADIAILKQLSQEIETALEAYVAQTNAELGAAGAPKRLSMDKAQPFIDIINKAVAYSGGVASANRGDLWEDLIAVAVAIGKDQTREKLANAIKESVVGSETSKVSVDGSLFVEDANIGAILGQTYSQNTGDGLYYSRHGTKDKVDVVLSWQGQKLNISAKNVSLSGYNANSVKIVEGMSLFIGLSNLGNAALATHYINQHALDGAATGDLYNQTAQLVKLSLLEQGLRGYKVQSAKADVFIINDNTMGRAIIVPMSRLLEKVVDTFPNLNVFTSFSADPTNLSFTSANQWSPIGYADRITKVLTAVHGAKVTIHLKPSLFKP